MAMQFPKNPTVGQTYMLGANGYVWSGDSWDGTADVVTQAALTAASKKLDNANPSLSGSININQTTVTDGIKVNNKYPWMDVVGTLAPRSSSTGAAIQTSLFNALVAGYPLTATSVVDVIFHVPHDYMPGTDVFLHHHWGHQGTAISGSLVITANISMVTRTAGISVMTTPVVSTTTISGLTITNMPKWSVRIDETQISTPGGSSTMLDTNAITPDSLIIIRYSTPTIPSLSGSAVKNNPYFFASDIHMQSNMIGTPNKDPNFYA